MNRYAASAAPPRPPKIDREKTCPSLLRVFVKTGVHHQDVDFSISSLPTSDEHQVYTWSVPCTSSFATNRPLILPIHMYRRDTTLREVLALLREADPSLRSSPLARYSLRLVFWDADADRFKSEELATIAAKDLLSSASAGGRGVYSNPRLDRTLADAKFVVGDFLDVACLGTAPAVPQAASVPPSAPQSGYGPRGAAVGPGPQFAPPPHSRGGPPGARGGPPVGFSGARGGPGGRRDDTTWAPVSRGGPGGRAAPYPPRGGGAGGPVEGRVADQGWGRRRPSASDDRPPPPRRRDSRSVSPDRQRRRSPSYSRSPPPHLRKGRGGDMDTRE
ncbi:hypothetical protein JCM11641_006067 [Rhodosporidiobolus odoratus]